MKPQTLRWQRSEGLLELIGAPAGSQALEAQATFVEPLLTDEVERDAMRRGTHAVEATVSKFQPRSTGLACRWALDRAGALRHTVKLTPGKVSSKRFDEPTQSPPQHLRRHRDHPSSCVTALPTLSTAACSQHALKRCRIRSVSRPSPMPTCRERALPSASRRASTRGRLHELFKNSEKSTT